MRYFDVTEPYRSFYDRAATAMCHCNRVEAIDVMISGINAGCDPADLFVKGFGCGIREVGEMFGQGRILFPELVLAADAMKAVFELVPQTTKEIIASIKPEGIVILATVEGDIHDIGKSLVVSMMKSYGIEVVDLGCDVPVDIIINRAIECDAKIIGTSALLTSTMTQQRTLEETLTRRGLRHRFRTMVGGAPVTLRWAREIGADVWAEDASDAASVAFSLLTGKLWHDNPRSNIRISTS
ncbi:MAG: cobalamin-dependent protein [Bacillota bacterium]|nr:cobalamin-dependent protein [Bacillota bacterium]